MVRDMLRAMRIVPGFGAAARIHLVEPSPCLEVIQRETLSGFASRVAWHASLDALVAAQPTTGRGIRPLIVVANEVLDTMCPDQLVRTADGWAMRCVGLDDVGALAFTTVPLDRDAHASDIAAIERRHPDAVPGDIVEWARLDLGALLALEQATLLLIDYGRAEPAIGDTLQAVREHRFEHPLTSPGEADISAYVDFDAVARCVADAPGATLHGPITQAELLGRLGIIERASRLMAANPDEAGEIEAGVARLLAPTGMGGRFLAVAVTPRGAPTPPAFDRSPSSRQSL
jgi:SAM-dependent MidA family methyltransferase